MARDNKHGNRAYRGSPRHQHGVHARRWRQSVRSARPPWQTPSEQSMHALAAAHHRRERRSNSADNTYELTAKLTTMYRTCRMDQVPAKVGSRMRFARPG
eukprot:6195540-Pleurochrysis_carterae.AAC.1